MFAILVNLIESHYYYNITTTSTSVIHGVMKINDSNKIFKKTLTEKKLFSKVQLNNPVITQID